MGTISARLPDDLEAEFERYLEAEHLDRSTAVRKFLAEELEEWRQEHALEQLEAGEVTFDCAAELAGCSRWDFVQLVRDRDITWVDRDGVEADLDAL